MPARFWSSDSLSARIASELVLFPERTRYQHRRARKAERRKVFTPKNLLLGMYADSSRPAARPRRGSGAALLGSAGHGRSEPSLATGPVICSQTFLYTACTLLLINWHSVKDVWARYRKPSQTDFSRFFLCRLLAGASRSANAAFGPSGKRISFSG